MKRIVGFFACLLIVSVGCAQQSEVDTEQETENRISFEATPSGQVEIRDTEKHYLHSEIIGETYEIDIFLPKHYKSSSQSYPVLYICDAEYNFGAVSYITRRLMKNHDLPEIILVGIAYDTKYEDFYNKRSRDMTPSVADVEGWESGGAEKFADFIERELFPWVDGKFRTIKGDRGICGHSYGGLFANWLLFKRTGMFSRYIIASPSYWFDDGISFDFETDYAKTHDDLKARVYLSVGAEERSHMVTNVQRMDKLLLSRKYPSLALKTRIIEEENHRSVFPIIFTKALRHIYSETP